MNEKDLVNQPPHYKTASIECFDLICETQGTDAAMGFCIGNAVKYLYRHNNKNGLEDVKKARWYLDKYIELASQE